MTEAPHSRAKQIFLDALAIAADERVAFLASACDGDSALRSNVEALIAAYERSNHLESLIGDDSEPDSDAPLALVGDYELQEELGRGAAGIVYRARQTSLGREVAIKILRAGNFASENDVRRFRREAEAAAALDHPCIVQVFDIGDVDGHHFFSMKLVDGASLDRVLDRLEGDPRRAAHIVATVARAVHHAHCRGVLHRDLKPSNILLDENGVPHVADFGIAQPIGQARITQTGLICGTPAYMSPEQARGSKDVTVATDIWSLGCVLHELLVGTCPFEGEGIAEVLRRVQDEPAPRVPHLDRDLSTIIGTCLAKDPLSRYPTALVLAEDLQRWLDHVPITARPTTRLERLRLLCRRSPVATSLSIVVVVLLLVLGIGASVTSLVLRDQLAETRAANASSNERLRASLVANARAERRSGLAGRRAQGLDLLRQAAAIAPGPDLRDDAITTLTLADLVMSPSWDGGTGGVIAVDAEFERLAMAHSGGRVELCSPLDGKPIVQVCEAGGEAYAAVFTHGSQRLWLSRKKHGATPARLEVFDLTVRPPARIWMRETQSGLLSCSHDGRTVALARGDGAVELIDADTHALRHAGPIPNAKVIRRGAFRPDDGALAVPTATGHRVEVISVPGGSSLASLTLPDDVRSVDWSPEGDLLIAGCFDQKAYVYDTSSWEKHAVLRGHGGELVGVAMLPGRLAATQAWDRTTRIWDIEVGTELLRCNSTLIALACDGRRLLMGREGSVAVAELISGDVMRVLHAHEGKAPKELAESPDGRWLATCGDTAWLLWDAHTGEKLVRTPTGLLHAVSFEPTGQAVLTSGVDGFRRWPLLLPERQPDVNGETGHPVVSEPETLVAGVCRRSSVSPDGRWSAVAQPPNMLLLGSGGSRREIGRHVGLDRVAFSSDGAWVAVGSWGGDGVRVWATDSAELVTHLARGEKSAMATFSPDDTRIVVTTFSAVTVHRTEDWTVERTFRREERYPSLPAAFSKGGELMAMSIARGRIRLVATEDWRTVAHLKPAKPHNLFHMKFLRDGRRLAIATPDHRLLIWELQKLWAELVQRGFVDSEDLPLRTTK